MLSRVLIVPLLVCVGLAGCTDGDGGTDAPVSPEGLAAGTGAISGLLVDDRFRPLHLTDEPDGAYERTGFILLSETGATAQTSINGEFGFTGLEPGTYTLRAQIDGHELTPSTVRVEADTITESTLIARRIANVDGAILTVEHTVYISCAFDYIQNGGNGLPPHIGIGCDGDISDDGYESNFIADYSSHGPNATWLVTEMLANQDATWELQLRGSSIYATEWATGDYARIALERGQDAPDHQDNPGITHGKWQNAESFQTILFVDHALREEQQSVTQGLFCCGVGATFGVRALILQSVFLGIPETDPAVYCVLC